MPCLAAHILPLNILIILKLQSGNPEIPYDYNELPATLVFYTSRDTVVFGWRCLLSLTFMDREYLFRRQVFIFELKNKKLCFPKQHLTHSIITELQQKLKAVNKLFIYFFA